MAASNSLDISQTGLVKFDGVATFTGVTVTEHFSLVGAANNGITSVTPSTAGFVLTSNGVSADPSFQAVPSSFNPNAVMTFYEDFLGVGTPGTSTPINYSWSTTGTQHFQVGGNDSGHPGCMGNQSTGSGANLALNGTNFILGGGAIQFNMVFKLVNLSDVTNRYTFRAGLGDTVAADQVNGAYVEYSDNINSGNWVYKTASSSTRTTTNSSTAVTADWHNLGITINAAATSVSFTMDGVSLGTAITTHIPTTSLDIFIDFIVSAGTVGLLDIIIDLAYMSQTLTTPR